MPRAYHIPGIVGLFVALILLILVSVSLPWLPTLDISRVSFTNGTPVLQVNSTVSSPFSQLRFGIWAACWYETPSGSRSCDNASLGYSTIVFSPDLNASVTIDASWTRGLVVHPVAAGVTLVAFLFSLSTHVTSTLIASLTAFLAATLTFIAFALDIALFAFAKRQMRKLPDVSESTDTGASFWITLVAFLLLFISGTMVALGRRRDRMADAINYPMPSSRRSSKA